MKFINLDNGKVFDGSRPYVHWMGDDCGIDIIYNKQLCFIHPESSVTVSLKSDVFSLIDTDKLKYTFYENVNGFEYVDINKLKSDKIVLTGTKYGNSYIYILSLIASADAEGEYIDDIIIGDEFISIGIDAYGDNEALYINMSNMGINIPNSIQKAIYPTNVHEDNEDKILLNRKWKELLSNYWDTIANKGSYKSLINSLKWFEWGNKLKVSELWKYKDSTGSTFYESRDIQTYVNELYEEEMTRFSKSTYYAIYKASQTLFDSTGKILLDKEKNPIPHQVLDKWTKEDIMLKLSLLGSFFETYFMPIHLDLIHCTIEDIVFTNNIKQITASTISCNDYYINTGDVTCSLDKNNTFSITNTSSQVNSDTIFAYKDISKNTPILGVDDKISIIKNDDDLKLFMSQYFNGIGVIVPVKYNIPLSKTDFIIKEELYIKEKYDEDWLYKVEHNIIKENEGNGIFEFNILCQHQSEYDIKICFTTAGGGSYVKTNKIIILDDTNISLGIFKIHHNVPTKEMWHSAVANEYFIDRCLNKEGSKPNIIKQYVPVLTEKPHNNKHLIDKRGPGVKLNNVLIFLSEKLGDEWFDDYHEYLREHYFIWHTDYKKRDSQGKLIQRKQYTVCVSKKYWWDPNPYLEEQKAEGINLMGYVYRNDYGYFPEFHYVQEISGDSLEDYTIYDDDAICVIPLLGDLKGEPLKYGKYVNDVAWDFTNISTGYNISLDKSIREPFVSEKSEKLLTPGYYNITFNYKLGNEDRKITLNSAFLRANGIRKNKIYK